MKADKNVSTPTEKRNELEFAIGELQHRLHDSVRQWHALVVATATICGLATLSTHGIDLVRSLMVTVSQSATTTLELSANLQNALRAREETTDGA